MKKIIMTAVLSSTALFLTACEREKPISVENSNPIVEVTKVKRPKHFRVYVRNTETGDVFNLQSNKHCNSWKNIKVGDRYKISRVKYTYADGRVSNQYYPRSCELAKNTTKWR